MTAKQYPINLNEEQKKELENCGYTTFSTGRKYVDVELKNDLLNLAYKVRHSDGKFTLEEMKEMYRNEIVHDFYLTSSGSIYRGDSKSWFDLEFKSFRNHFVRFQISIEDAKKIGFSFEYEKKANWAQEGIIKYNRKNEK